LKTFGAKNGCYIAVFVLNTDSGTSPKQYIVNLNDSFKVDANHPYRLKFAMGKSQSYKDTIEAQSTTLLLFNCAGGISKKYRFKVADTVDAFNPYFAKTSPADIYTVSAGADQQQCCSGCAKTFTATVTPNQTGFTYQWYKNGTLQSGATFSTYACYWNGVPNTYTVKVVATHTATGCTTEDEALLTYTGTGPGCDGPEGRYLFTPADPNVVMSGSEIQAIVPNPAQNKVSVFYSIVKNANSEITIMNYNGQVVGKYKVNSDEKSIDIDCSSLASGIYFTSLTIDGKAVSTKKLVISK
jgi:hypothetical protein